MLAYFHSWTKERGEFWEYCGLYLDIFYNFIPLQPIRSKRTMFVRPVFVEFVFSGPRFAVHADCDADEGLGTRHYVCAWYWL